MSNLFPNINLDNLRGDLFGGLTAAVVALPLALAFGVASGLGPMAGLYGAIATGFFAALFGGTGAQITGPTGPMTVVMGGIVATYATNLPEAFAIVILGGMLQIAFGALKLGRYIVYTPYSVVSGFMTGIAVIIILIQILPFMGLPTAMGGAVGALTVLANLDLSTINYSALALAALTLAIAIYWPTNLHKYVPPPLAALVIGTGLGLFWLTGVPTIGAIPSSLPDVAIPTFELVNIGSLIQGGFVLALLGSIDSLLTSLVADSMTRAKHHSDRELVGQGIGNIAAGLLGALPGAGATMRTVINIRSGGRTPVAGMIHAIVLLVLALGLGPLAEAIPHAVLAGILVKVGVDIADWRYLSRLTRVPPQIAVVMLATFGLTVFVDLIIAVAVGIILAHYVSANRVEKEQLKGITQAEEGDTNGSLTEEELGIMEDANGSILVTMLRGIFSYASARELERLISENTTKQNVLIYDFSEAGYVDATVAMAVDGVVVTALANDQIVFFSGLRGEVKQSLVGFGVAERVGDANIFETRHDAIMAAAERLGVEHG